MKTGNIIKYFFKVIFSDIIYYNTSLVSKTVSGMRNNTYLNIGIIRHSNQENSFERLPAIAKKCTPSQIMLYQSALHFHKVLNQQVLSFERVTVLHNMTCSRRQTTFDILRNNNVKIGMNATANKFYCLSGKISLLVLNYEFVHYKTLMKLQFLKNGKT